MVLGELSRSSPVCFHTDVDRYQAAVAHLSAGSAAVVPALLPGDPYLAKLWPDVIRDQFGAPRPPTPGTRVVVTVAGWAQGPATVLARMTGSRVVVCADPDSVGPALTGATEPSVLVIAPANMLTVARIMAVDKACRAGGRTWGLVTGRGLPELAYAVAKTVLRPRAGLTGRTVVDAPSHREAENRASAAADRLTDPALCTLIRSHGEGGHAKLPGTVVCGVLGHTEFPDQPDVGCSRQERRCKRAHAHARVLFAHEVRAVMVAFVCCNGFNVAGELYPSPVSMALGMTEGWAQTLIAPVRPLVAPDSMVARLRELLHAGVMFGEIVQRMNELGERLGQPHAFVLHGDPRDRLDLGTVPAELSGPVEMSGPAEAAPDTGWILRALVQTERGTRLLRSMRAWLGEETPAVVHDLDTRLARTGGVLLNTLKWSEALPTAESVAGQARSRFLAASAVSAFDRTVCALLLEARDVFDAYDLGHYDQRLLGIVKGEPCVRCGTPTEVSTFGGDRGDDDQRRAESCVICGPVSEGRLAGLRLTVVDGTAAGSPGDEFCLRVRVSTPMAGSMVRGVHLRMRFFDKAVGGCVADQTRVVAATDQDVEFGFVLPDGLGVDLHSVRVVAASDCDVAYARARFAGLPAELGR